jgi:hypothetical protein
MEPLAHTLVLLPVLLLTVVLPGALHGRVALGEGCARVEALLSVRGPI